MLSLFVFVLWLTLKRTIRWDHVSVMVRILRFKLQRYHRDTQHMGVHEKGLVVCMFIGHIWYIIITILYHMYILYTIFLLYTIYYIHIYIYTYLCVTGWWWLEHDLFFHILGIIIDQYFSEVVVSETTNQIQKHTTFSVKKMLFWKEIQEHTIYTHTYIYIYITSGKLT